MKTEFKKHWSDKFLFLLTPMAEPYVFYYLFAFIPGLICSIIGHYRDTALLKILGMFMMAPFAIWLALFLPVISIVFLIELYVECRDATKKTDQE